ncbi:SIS domain-containing protein [Yinghuangia sp. ASG 101]|uniref:SIS domain-containing protein n=1 Tax=Yinghuangia sp. ASG 101 TaxID=2896848 RepID=UPI001E47931A|nr:SIS domain-containing protein [Yinghuangia sp. ASG 101]UGQ11023.1 SIS domain-containing protein [Yinghuangia sp. ASG 101]
MPPASTEGATPRGKLMSVEMAEQPEVLRRLTTDGLARIRQTAAAIARRGPRFVLLTARGTSDNAALYAKYLVEVLLGKPAGLTSMSTTTIYGAEPNLTDCLVITVSQSGGSPDLVASTEAARKAGAVTLAVTNNPDSPLAAVAEFHLDMLAGAEKALPATKTYTAALLTLYLFVEGLRDGDCSAAATLPDLAEHILDRRTEVAELAQRYRFAQRLVITSRGYGYPTAREGALKIMETGYIPAASFSGADLLHGPLAMLDDTTPVIAVVPGGPAGRALEPVLERVRERGADLGVIGHADEVARATAGFVLPSGVPDALRPILEILPLQRLAYEISIARGLDPDTPRALAKVTETR